MKKRAMKNKLILFCCCHRCRAVRAGGFFKNLPAMSTPTAKNYIAQRFTEIGLRDFVLNLDRLAAREKIIFAGLDLDMESSEVIAKEVNLSAQRVQQLGRRARRKIAMSLREYFRFKNECARLDEENRLLQFKVTQMEALLSEQGKPVPTVEQIDAMPIEDIDMSVRLYNVLKSHRLNLVGDIKNVGNEILGWRDFGKKTYIELVEHMKELGITWPVNQPQLH